MQQAFAFTGSGGEGVANGNARWQDDARPVRFTVDRACATPVAAAYFAVEGLAGLAVTGVRMKPRVSLALKVKSGALLRFEK